MMPVTIQPTTLKYKNGNSFQSADCLKGDKGDPPVLTSSKSGKTTTIYSDGTQLAQIQDGADGVSSVTDVQVNGTSVVTSSVASIPLATSSSSGVVKVDPSYGTAMRSSPNESTIMIRRCPDADIKNGNDQYRPLTPYTQHMSTFYGLAKAAGDSTQASSSNAVGTYTSDAKSAIRTMLDVPSTSDIPSVPVTDVQINGSSILSSGVANVPVANANNLGTVKVDASNGIGIESQNKLYINYADDNLIKSGTTGSYRPITPPKQHQAVFYGLAKAAGNTDQSSSSNAVGTYTADALVKIQKMLGIYEAPWELIREDTFTNASASTHQITVDGNGNAFELTDAVLMFETPVQETASSANGNIVLTDGTSNIASLYCGSWTQTANGIANGCWVVARRENGLAFVYARLKSTSTNMSYNSQSYMENFAYNSAQSIVESTNFIIRGAKIANVLGTGHYKLYGKRKWTV